MSLTWHKRKARLSSLLNSTGDEHEHGLALDRILHGQTVIGKTSKTAEIDSLRFNDGDLHALGTLEHGQFGVIDVVSCRLDGRVYVRKSAEKAFALRTREQCSPQTERDILLRATQSETEWAPHLLCAFQTTTHLNLVMDYIEGGTLWDVLESSPHDNRILESDLRWWTPQIVSAIHWCHSQGFVHRDIKPHNFVLSSDSHVLLIDFGSAAPLLPPRHDGSQRISKRYCLVPCGTCDYISPEILQAHEEALLALEMSVEERPPDDEESDGYGRETDWWSLGSMLYEMAYGVAPFFASDIRQTYLKIMNHTSSLRFNKSVNLSDEFRDLLRRLLTNCEQRIGRKDVEEVKAHLFFRGLEWTTLRSQRAPPGLHLPQFTYTLPMTSPQPEPGAGRCSNDTPSRVFAFSAFFQSSHDSLSPQAPSFHHSTPNRSTRPSSVSLKSSSAFIGFSWGPPLDAFSRNHGAPIPTQAPSPLRVPSTHATQRPGQAARPDPSYSTPKRPNSSSALSQPQTGNVRRTAPRRNITDREAMQLLTDCVGMSARKKVLDSGRKPRVLPSYSRSGLSLWKKELKFDTSGDAGHRAEQPNPLLLSSDTESEGPPSPSPSPRPGSAMSSVKSRKSGTPSLSTQCPPQLETDKSSIPSKRTDVRHIFPQEQPALHAGAAPSSSSLELSLEQRHQSLMEEIRNIEHRLGNVLTHMCENG